MVKLRSDLVYKKFLVVTIKVWQGKLTLGIPEILRNKIRRKTISLPVVIKLYYFPFSLEYLESETSKILQRSLRQLIKSVKPSNDDIKAQKSVEKKLSKFLKVRVYQIY